MKRVSIALSLGAVLIAPALAQNDPGLQESRPLLASPLTANIGLFSSYRFRGLDQTDGRPALQGGFDYAHASGFYVGNWNSNVQAGAGYPGSSLEMDFYGGYRKNFGDFGVDAGFLYYAYPGTDSAPGRVGAPTNNRNGKVATGRVDNKEIYLAASWKTISLKYSHALGDYFSTPDTKNSSYLDLTATHDLGEGWGLIGHLGHLHFRNMDGAGYSDWKLGVTKDVSGWLFAASYIATNAKGDCGKGEFYCFSNSGATAARNAGRTTAVVSVSRTF